MQMNRLLESALTPLSFAWETAYKLRRYAFRYELLKQEAFKVPIISVGNLSFGGTGKTPFTILLADRFLKKNLSVLILMRGYKGKLESSSGAIRGGTKIGSAPIDFGDEAVLISRKLPKVHIVVGKNRTENLKKYYSTLKPDVVILDDGHQHLKIDRIFNFVLFDVSRPMSHFRVAPLGYLREGLTALEEANSVIFTKANLATPEKIVQIKKLISPYVAPDVTYSHISYAVTGVMSDHHVRALLPRELYSKRVICIAGIANKESFFKLVDELGAEIVKTINFPDHHKFSLREIELALKLAQDTNSIILTTEKDIVKIRRITDDKRIFFLEIGLDITQGEDNISYLVDAVTTGKYL